MPWYKSGTVSVTQNSNAVIGSNTAFIANSRVGDGFRGPDGGWYEVTNIASNTAMSIAPNYQGATNNAGGYALAPMQGYVKDSADALRALVNQFGSTLAVLGTSGTREGVRAALAAAASGNNSDILSLSGLTTALTIEQGGTGKKTAGEAIQALGGIRLGAGNSSAGTSLFSGAPPSIASISSSNNDGNTALRIANAANNSASAVMTFIRDTIYGVHLGLDTDNKFKLGGFSMGAVARALYHEGNLVGTVSQSGGIPTGAVIEAGALNGGTYTKFADGTLICRGTSSSQLTANGAGGSVYYSGAFGFTFAAPFVSVPAVVMQAVNTSGYFCWAAAEGAASATGITGRVVSPANGANAYLSHIAIGRWF
ncbi:phage tail protein [Pseudomonas syringae]|uniref:phage tail protein n=1 Tax=Pseudomonas syringae TaxID=317 RepID=UPI000F000FBD|nr:phage tail protein [Pseudomonas syringae]RMM20703.1 Tail fiber domain-containing protein [Pseudomonas syringae pv. pisi]